MSLEGLKLGTRPGVSAVTLCSVGIIRVVRAHNTATSGNSLGFIDGYECGGEGRSKIR